MFKEMEKRASENNGGYLIPDVFVRGGHVKVTIDKPGIWYALVRSIGRIIIAIGTFIWEEGIKIRDCGRGSKWEYTPGLLKLAKKDDDVQRLV